MKRLPRRTLLVATLALGLLAPAARAEEVRAGDLVIRDPWAVATVGGQKASGAFMVIENRGNTPAILVGVVSPVAKKVQIHRTIMKDGVARMVPQARIEIPPKGEVVLKRGGLHVMLMGLHQPLAAGDRIPLTLRFAERGNVQLEVPVRPPFARRDRKARGD